MTGAIHLYEKPGFDCIDSPAENAVFMQKKLK